MDVKEAVEGIRQHLEAVVASAQEKLEQEIPVAAAAAGKISQDPLVQAAMSTALSDGAKQLVVDLIGRLAQLEAGQAAAAPPAESAESAS